jgi:putative lipoprotein
MVFLRSAALAATVVFAAGTSQAGTADPWFGRDKALHFSASAALASGGYAAGAIFSDSVEARLMVGAGLALGAGVGKEVFDRYGGGDPSWRDLTWDVVGTACGLGVAWVFDRYVFSHRRR